MLGRHCMKKELLAPAGDIEAGYAALYYGADAVYLGLKQFSARASANNFSEEELNEFTGFAHHLGRKVFVTINTVLQQSELKDLVKNLDICRRCKVDAVILQDLGVAGIIKKHYPEIELHASTQMAVHNKAGALALKEMGFSRVVLARELTLPEIKEIASIPNLELEAFVHGALCYSYSGICQFSSMINGRSANRGKCMYPCRAEFSENGKTAHRFSMKDMALQEDVLKMPVYSLKIEGRKKNALYVAAVTDYYRSILDGGGNLGAKAQNIKQIFSRPWCSFHFKGRSKEVTDTKFVGHRGLPIGKISEIKGASISFATSCKIARHDGIQIDVDGCEKPYGFSLQKMKAGGKTAIQAEAGQTVEILLPQKISGLKKGASVYLASSSEVKGAYGYQKPKPKEFLQRIGIDVSVTLASDKLKASSCGETAEISGTFSNALDIAKTEDAIKKAFAKTGDTEFFLQDLHIENPQGLFAPISVLNELRRSLYEQIVPQDKTVVLPFIEPRRLPIAGKWIVKTDSFNAISLLDWQKIDEFIFLINPDTKTDEITKFPKNKLRIALPAVCRNTKDFEPLISKLLDGGYKKWEIANYWGLSVLPVKKIDLSFDNLIYMFNAEAVQTAKEIGASRITLAVEDTLSNLKDLAASASLPVAFTVYQDVPLFTSAVCIRENSCKECSRRPLWMTLAKDGQKFQALSQNCQLMMFAKKPFAAASEAKEIRADFYKADFCYKNYPPAVVKQILEKLMRFENPDGCLQGNLTRRSETF